MVKPTKSSSPQLLLFLMVKTVFTSVLAHWSSDTTRTAYYTLTTTDCHEILFGHSWTTELLQSCWWTLQAWMAEFWSVQILSKSTFHQIINGIKAPLWTAPDADNIVLNLGNYPKWIWQYFNVMMDSNFHWQCHEMTILILPTGTFNIWRIYWATFWEPSSDQNFNFQQKK